MGIHLPVWMKYDPRITSVEAPNDEASATEFKGYLDGALRRTAGEIIAGLMREGSGVITVETTSGETAEVVYGEVVIDGPPIHALQLSDVGSPVIRRMLEPRDSGTLDD
jgi:hypothetical protein